jgi:hypothetical protein
MTWWKVNGGRRALAEIVASMRMKRRELERDRIWRMLNQL